MQSQVCTVETLGTDKHMFYTMELPYQQNNISAINCSWNWRNSKSCENPNTITGLWFLRIFPNFRIFFYKSPGASKSSWKKTSEKRSYLVWKSRLKHSTADFQSIQQILAAIGHRFIGEKKGKLKMPTHWSEATPTETFFFGLKHYLHKYYFVSFINSQTVCYMYQHMAIPQVSGLTYMLIQV